MKNNRSQVAGRRSGVARGCFCVFMVVLLATAGVAQASDSTTRFRIEAGHLTGQLREVPLRVVLKQLRDQLGIEYVAPNAELNKVVSVSLRKEPVSSALSKILAPWDYALIVDGTGRIKTLYLMEKVDKGLSSEESRGRGQAFDPEEPVESVARDEWMYPESDRWQEDRLTSTASLSPHREDTSRSYESGSRFPGGSMGVEPPAPGTTMPIFPAKDSDMPINPGGRGHAMEIIPSTAFPPLSILPVPEHVQEEMLIGLRR